MVTLTLLLVSLAANAALAVLWRRQRRPMPVINAADFDPERVQTVPVAIRCSDEGIYLANPETGKRLEFTGCTAWSGHMAPQLGKASIRFSDLSPWPGHDLPQENLAEILLEHVPVMT